MCSVIISFMISTTPGSQLVGHGGDLLVHSDWLDILDHLVS